MSMLFQEKRSILAIYLNSLLYIYNFYFFSTAAAIYLDGFIGIIFFAFFSIYYIFYATVSFSTIFQEARYNIRLYLHIMVFTMIRFYMIKYGTHIYTRYGTNFILYEELEY